jgi:hypothetical protein
VEGFEMTARAAIDLVWLIGLTHIFEQERIIAPRDNGQSQSNAHQPDKQKLVDFSGNPANLRTGW